MQFNTVSKLFLGIGSLIFTAASLLGFGGGFDAITNSQIQGLKPLVKENPSYQMWEKMVTPAQLGFYFFNLTNPNEFSQGAKAILREMGPYVYREDWVKQDVMESEENDTIRYRMTKTFHFDQDQTDGSETDRISIINPVFVATAAMSHDVVGDAFLLEQFDKILTAKGESLVLQGTVRQFLFDGVPLKGYMDILHNPAIKQVLEDLEISFPDELKDGTFALLKNKNGTDDGWYTVRRGKTNPEEAGQVVMYNDQENLAYWTDECNAINGTDGSIFPPFITKETRLQIFAPGMCRSFPMHFYKESRVSEDATYQFIMDQGVWQAPKTNPANSCFCPQPNEHITTNPAITQTCDKDGVFNLGPCSDGAPLLLSQPHFIGAEDWIRESIDGLEPEFDNHVTMIDFQPLTGMPLKSVNRFQYNVEIVPVKEMPTFAKLKHAIIPFAWIEETTKYGETEMAGVRFVLLLQTILMVGQYALMSIGLLLSGQGLLLAKNNKKHASPVKPFTMANGELSKSHTSIGTSETAFTFA